MTAETGEGRRRRAARRRPPRPRLRVALPVLVVIVTAFLYYRPLSSYMEARQQLGERRAEVVELRAEKARLERRLERTTSLDALAREARRIGLVRPGERLFIVKGIKAWRHGEERCTPLPTTSGSGCR